MPNLSIFRFSLVEAALTLAAFFLTADLLEARQRPLFSGGRQPHIDSPEKETKEKKLTESERLILKKIKKYLKDGNWGALTVMLANEGLSSWAKAQAAKALGTLRKTQAIPALLAATHADDDVLRIAAVTALGNIGDPEPLSRILKLFSDKTPSIRLAAAQAARRLGTDPLPHLTKTANSEEYFTRYISAVTLGDLGDTRAGGILIQLLDDPKSFIRHAADKSLVKLFNVNVGFMAFSSSRETRLKSIEKWKKVWKRSFPPVPNQSNEKLPEMPDVAGNELFLKVSAEDPSLPLLKISVTQNRLGKKPLRFCRRFDTPVFLNILVEDLMGNPIPARNGNKPVLASEQKDFVLFEQDQAIEKTINLLDHFPLSPGQNVVVKIWYLNIDHGLRFNFEENVWTGELAAPAVRLMNIRIPK